MRSLTAIGWTAGIACVAFGAATARGDHYFSDEFNGPSFNPNLVDIQSSYTFASGRTGTSAIRSYVRTVESDYAAIDFRAELVYSISGSGGDPGIFFGMGPATKDTGFFSEPESALYLLDHTNGFPAWPNSDMVVRVNGAGAANITDLANTPFPDGLCAARITKVGDSITFQYDHTYNGTTFTPDGSYATTLSAAAPFLTSGPSYLLFGTSVSPSRFDSIAVTIVPEPATAMATLLAGGSLVVCGRRRG